MVSKNSRNQPDWLPNDWKLQIKLKSSRKFKCYVHSKTSLKLYSRLAVLRYIKNERNASSNGTENHAKKSLTEQENEMNASSNGTEKHAKKNSTEQENQFVAGNDELPAGWTVEVKMKQSGPSKGTHYKCYSDPSSGSKFYSKPEVFRYLQSIKNSAGPSGQEERRSTRHSSSNRPVNQQKAQESDVEPTVLHNSKTIASRRVSSGKKEKPVDQQKAEESNGKLKVSQSSKATTSRELSSGKVKVVIENTVDKDLPSGWIKEMRKKIHGTHVRTDPFYYHPASGLVFRSKPEVLRYLKTCEISRHAYWRKIDAAKEDSTIEKTSPLPSLKRETTTNRKTRKEFLAGEEIPIVNPSLTPGIKVVEEADVKRITRSSSKVRPVSVTEVKPDQSSGEETPKRSPSLTPEIRVVNEADVRRITRSLSNVRPVSVSEAKPDQSSLLLETTKISKGKTKSKTKDQKMNRPTEENTVVVSMKGCSNKKAETAKRRKTEDQETINMPSRSFKRLAGIDDPPVSVSEAKPDQSSLLLETTEVSQETTRSKTEGQKSKTVAASMNGCSPKKAQTTKTKTKDQNLLTTPSRSSKRLAGVEVQPVFLSIPIEHAHRAPMKKSIGSAFVPSVVTVTNDLQDEPKRPDAELQNVHNTLDVSTETVLSTELCNNSDSLTQNTLPVFSEKEVIVVPPINTDLSSENRRNHPIPEGQPDPILGRKIEKSLTDWPALEGQLGSVGTGTNQAGAEFSFPPPLWSDPCLEFAYKTLTGAIPLDDNLAIEDYIQYQLRTSKPSNEFQSLPDIDMPSFPQNDETKQVPTLPEGIRLPNGNGSAPNKTNV